MTKFKNIKHVFFDLDHTLWDFDKNSKESYAFIFQKNNININIDAFLNNYTKINHQYWKLYRENKVTKAELKHGRLLDTFKKINYSISKELIDILAEEYLENLSNYNHLFEHTTEILEYLRPKYKLHIITNGFHEIQFKKMQNANLLNYFDIVITSENIGVKKPNPKIFFHALKQANAKTYESIMIGDNLEADVYGAKNIGVLALYFNEQTQKIPKSILQIKKLNEIKLFL